METIEEYLTSTKSAMEKLFEGIECYLAILQDVKTPFFVANYGDEDDFPEKVKARFLENEDQRKKKQESVDCYLNEVFAQSTLCGAVLQIAAMGIKTYSKNRTIPESCQKITKIELAKKYCIGRIERGLPIGLIIYAGRNQYNHLDDKILREPSQSIFEAMTTVGESKFVSRPYKDPCFDISNPELINYASNITGLLGWRNYERYKRDMLSMLCDEKN